MGMWISSNIATQGTSFSAPIVTGVAGLIWNAYPMLTAEEVKKSLILDKSLSLEGLTLKTIENKSSSSLINFKGDDIPVLNTLYSLKYAERLADGKNPPILSLIDDSKKTYEITEGDLFNAELIFAMFDDIDLEPTLELVSGSSDLNIPGTYILTYVAVDAAGRKSDLETITVIVNEKPNQPAVISPAIIILTETDDILMASGQLTSSDSDNLDNKFIASEPSGLLGVYGRFDIDVDGNWNFQSYSAFNELNVGDQYSETFNISSIDGTPGIVEIFINGTAESLPVDIDSKLVAYYKFDNNPDDSSINGNNGIKSGNVTYVPGVRGQAVAIGDYNNPGHVRVLNSSSLQFTDKFTVSYFVRLDSQYAMDGWGRRSTTGGSRTVFAKDHDRTGIFSKSYFNSSTETFGSSLSKASYSGTPFGVGASKDNYALGEWVHVAFVVDGDELVSYINGVENNRTTGNTVDFSTSNSRDLYLGKFSSYWYPLGGSIDEFRLYNRALNSAEVSEIFNLSNQLLTKIFGGNESVEQMKNRYQNNIDYYVNHPEYHKQEGFYSENLLSILTANCQAVNYFTTGIHVLYNVLSNFDLSAWQNNIDPAFYDIECMNKAFKVAGKNKANSMLTHFLLGSGSFVNIDMNQLFSDNPGVYNKIKLSIDDAVEIGLLSGRVNIAQTEWEGGVYSDWNLALGTINIEWEVNEGSVVYFLNDKYSFDIHENNGEFRWTSPLYLEAAALVINYGASDFYMTGRQQESYPYQPQSAQSPILETGGQVFAWDSDFESYGHYPDYQDVMVPSEIKNLTDIKEIALLDEAMHGLALRATGQVVGWGDNSHGQISVPTDLSNVVQVAVGEGHSLALKSDGTVEAWGNNDFGQSSVPDELDGVIVTSIAAGWNESFAVKSDGTVVAWGGDDIKGYMEYLNLTGVSKLVVNEGIIVLKKDGTVSAHGGLMGGTNSELLAVPVGLNNVADIQGGYRHVLALKADGSIESWGDNTHGQTSYPSGLTNVKKIAAGIFFSLAIKSDDSVAAWGSLGGDNGITPIVTPSLSNVSVIAGGCGLALAISN